MTRAQLRARRHIIRRSAIEAHRFALSVRDREEHQVADDLCGACAITAAYLLKLLHERGIKNARFVIGVGHSYVRVGKTMLVDATGMQFGYPRVWAKRGEPVEAQGDWVYRDKATAETPEEAADLLDNMGWMWDSNKIHEYVLTPQRRRVA